MQFKLNVEIVMKIYFILGYAGSGKSSFCKQTGYSHIALGDLLRRESEHNIVIRKCIEKGNLIPSEIVIHILKKALENCNNDCIIDGYPRNLDDVRQWNEEIGIEPSGIIFLECSERICLQRLLDRKRSDDNIICIKNRFLSFVSETLPVIRYYEASNVIIYNKENFKSGIV